MAFVFKVYEADGTTVDDSVYASGIITDCLHAEFVTGARAGLRGGRIELPGRVTEEYDIPIGACVKFFIAGTPDDQIYMGWVREGGRSVDGMRHIYELESAWSRLPRNVDLTTRRIFGTSGQVGLTTYDTPAKILKYILDDNSIAYEAEDIVDESTSIASFTVEAASDIYSVIEQLEVMASGAAPYYAGIDDQGDFYFKPISTTQQTFNLRIDTIAGEEREDRTKVINQIRLRGRQPADNMHNTRKRYADPTSITAYGGTGWVIMPTPGLKLENDMDVFAAGLFNRWGTAKVIVQNIRRVHADADDPVRPWLGLASYQDAAREGELFADVIGSATVTLDKVYRYNATVGAEGPGAETQIFAPTTDREDATRERWPDDDFYPDFTDETSLPADAPDGTGSVGTTDPGEETGPAVGIVGGHIDCGFASPASAIIGDTVRFIARINNGGAPTVGDETVFTARVRFRTEAGTWGTTATTTLARIYQEGNVETWWTATGYVPTEIGTYYCRFQFQKFNAGTENYWFPVGDETGEDESECQIKCRVTDPDSESGGGSTILIGAEWLDGAS